MHVLLVNLSVDLTGASRSSLVDSDSTSLPDFDRQLMMGVTSDEIDMLKQTANSAIHDSLLKKIQEIDQVSLAFTVILISLLFLIETIQKKTAYFISLWNHWNNFWPFFTDCQFFISSLYFCGFTFMANEWRLFYNLLGMVIVG